MESNNTEPVGFGGTKTPWEVDPEHSETAVYCDDELGSMVADCTVMMGLKIPIAEKKANALLIAQAKNMAVLLQRLRVVLAESGMSVEAEWCDEVLNKAISKV